MPLADVGDYCVYHEEHGAGEPVLLINGLGADHTAWALQTDALSTRFRVVVFDNPGVGQSTGPPGPYTYRVSLPVQLYANLCVWIDQRETLRVIVQHRATLLATKGLPLVRLLEVIGGGAIRMRT